MLTVDDCLRLAQEELDEATAIDKSGHTGMLGVAGQPAYHVNRASVYATMALTMAKRDA